MNGGVNILYQLYIKNVAIIKEVTINLEKGLNVFTGETGSGKSIIINSIGLLMGNRGTKDLIRTNEKSCFVSASFFNVSLETLKKLKLLGYNVEQDGNLLISREFFQDSKNICKINGKPCTVSVLKELSLLLINIHSQHETQTLFDSNIQRYLIDKYGQYNLLLTSYKTEFLKYNNLKKDIENFIENEEEKQKLLETLDFQIKEIDSAELKPNEEEKLLETKQIIKNSKLIKDNISESIALISGTDNENGISTLLFKLEKCLAKCEQTSKISKILTTVKETSYNISDIGYELASWLNDIDFNENEIDNIESRLDVIYKLKRKYGETYNDIMNFYSKIKEQFNKIQLSTKKQVDLQNQLEKELEILNCLAEKISNKRKETSEKFVNEVKKHLADLNMPNIDLFIDIKPIDFNRWGKDNLEILIATNLGEPLKPLTKVASGGELSRIMLAIKSVLSNNDFIETMIFDEIDTGVSGNTSYNIGLKLKKLSGKKQIISITHSAQIASLSNHHLLITKSTEKNQTFTHVKALNYDEQKYELARILGGAKITPAVLKNAQELLDSKAD